MTLNIENNGIRETAESPINNQQLKILSTFNFSLGYINSIKARVYDDGIGVYSKDSLTKYYNNNHSKFPKSHRKSNFLFTKL